MPRRQSAFFGAVLLVGAMTSCNRGVAPDPLPQTSADTTAASRALEKAALETGAITDIRAVDPVGAYQRSHEVGTDSMCLGPADGLDYPFAVSFVFAEQEHCAGSGEAKRSGDNLILRFEKADGCIVIARYDGDMIAMPGAVDTKCQALCTERGSLSGVTLPRISSAANPAVRDRSDDALCPES